MLAAAKYELYLLPAPNLRAFTDVVLVNCIIKHSQCALDVLNDAQTMLKPPSASAHRQSTTCSDSAGAPVSVLSLHFALPGAGGNGCCRMVTK